MLGLELPKIDLGKMVNMGTEGELIFHQTLEELYKVHDKTDENTGKEMGKKIRVGLIPELEQLMRK